MYKHFLTIDGKNYACDETGTILSVKELESVEGLTEVKLENDDVLSEVKALLEKSIEDSKKSVSDVAKEAREEIKSFFSEIRDEARTSSKNIDKELDSAEKALEAFVSKAEKFNKGESKAFTHSFSAKEIATLEKTFSESGSLTGDVIVPQRDETLDRNPVRKTFLESIANTFPVSSPTVEWVEVLNESGTPATTEELGTIPQKDFTFKTARTSLVKIGVANKHSKEILTDAPRLVNAIKNSTLR